MNLQAAARALGGKVRGNRVACPGPGHSPDDLSMWVTFDWQAPDGFVVGSFAEDDFAKCRDYVRAKLGLPAWKPRSFGSNCADTQSRKPGQLVRVSNSGKTFPTIGRRELGGSTCAALQSEQLIPIESRTQRALTFWNEARSLVGTVAEKYLIDRVGREIYWPSDLRYLAQCPRKTNTGLERHPALIVLLRNIDTDEPRAIQRIFLRPDGSDRLRDAMGKATLGPSAGCVCKLSPDADVTQGLGLVEGVEKGLSLLAAGWSPIWSTNGTSGMSSFPALSGIETLTVFADADLPGQNAAKHCASRWNDAGATVRIATPKIEGADWSDQLRAAA